MTQRRFTIALTAGLVLLAAYVATAVWWDDFALPTGADYEALHEQLDVDRRLIRDLAPPLLAGNLAKVLLLAPAVLLLGWCAARGRRDVGDGLLGRPSHAPPLVLICLIVFALLVFWSQVVFQGQPVYDDEFTYLFQAQCLEAGHLAAPAPPSPACFENVFIVLRGDVWAGKYTSGHPLLLALSHQLGWVRLVPFVLAALVPWLVYLIAVELGDRRAGLLAAVMLAVSPFFLMVSASLMNHGTGLFFLSVFTLGYLRAGRTRPWLWGVLAGLALGMAFNIRPQAAVAVGLPFGVWTLWRCRGEGRRALIAGLAVMLGLLPGLAYAGVYNHAVAGAWHRFAFMLLEGEAPTVAAFLGTGAHHTLWKGLGYDLLNLWRLNLYLLGFGLSLLPVVLGLVRTPLTAHDRVWLGAAGVTMVIYAGFPSPGVLELGPRYLFPLLIPLVIWMARGLLTVRRNLALAWVVLAVVACLVTFTREQARHLHQVTTEVARPYRFVEDADLDQAIVLVRAKPPSGWVFGLRNNHPRLADNDVIYTKLRGLGEVLELLDAMPARTVHVLAFDPADPSAEPELVPFTRAQLVELQKTWR